MMVRITNKDIEKVKDENYMKIRHQKKLEKIEKVLYWIGIGRSFISGEELQKIEKVRNWHKGFL